MRSDVVIIGGGLAGLTAAYQLRQHRPLILEATNRIGGRILTRVNGNVTYDLGAVVGYDPAKAPLPIKSSALTREDDPIGIHLEGRLQTGNSVDQCLSSSGFVREAVLEEIHGYALGRLGVDEMSLDAYRIVNGCFKVIHPGELKWYAPCVNRDVFRRYYPSHFAGGNVELVATIAAATSGTIWTGAEAVSVDERGDAVDVLVRRNGREQLLQARAVIVATTANVAARILTSADASCRDWLRGVRYGRYIIAAVCIRRPVLQGISYIVTPELVSDMIFNRSAGKGQRMILAYFGDIATEQIRAYTDTEICELVLQIVGTLDGKPIERSEVAFSDIARWSIGGTIISNQLVAQSNTGPWCRFGSPRVVLAGDYLHGKYPYGMDAAVRSGRSAAEHIAPLLSRGMTTKCAEEGSTSQ